MLATYSFDVIKVVYKNDITLRHFVSSRYEIPFGLNAQIETDRQMYQTRNHLFHNRIGIVTIRIGII